MGGKSNLENGDTFTHPNINATKSLGTAIFEHILQNKKIVTTSTQTYGLKSLLKGTMRRKSDGKIIIDSTCPGIDMSIVNAFTTRRNPIVHCPESILKQGKFCNEESKWDAHSDKDSEDLIEIFDAAKQNIFQFLSIFKNHVCVNSNSKKI